MGRQVARRGVRAIRVCMAKGLTFMLAMEVAGSLRVVEGCGQTWNVGAAGLRLVEEFQCLKSSVNRSSLFSRRPTYKFGAPFLIA